MTKSLILLPCWRRAEFLQYALENIQKANGAEKNCYTFLIDRGYSQEVVEVINNFPLNKELRFAPPHRHPGNSYNVLEGYLWASNQNGYNLVHLIEEDIMCSVDYFDFHERVQSKYDSFCVSACRNQNLSTESNEDSSAVYYHPSFQSLGISWKYDNLKKVVKHANARYYRNPTGYLRNQFPNSAKTNHTEQDGLIWRVMVQGNHQCLFPNVARCSHLGFVGYNRKGKPLEGTLAERVAKLRTMTATECNDRADVYKDITPIDLNIDYGVTDFVLRHND